MPTILYMREVKMMGLLEPTKKQLGERSQAHIIARLLEVGYTVLTPYGDSSRYDLVVEDAEGQFWRIQCKTARIEDNGTVVAFDTANHNVALRSEERRVGK